MVTQNQEHLCTIKVGTSYYRQGNILKMTREVRTLKRKSKGYDIFTEELQDFGAEETAGLLNLKNTEDGIYRVEACDIARNWESGVVEDYSLKLIKLEEFQ